MRFYLLDKLVCPRCDHFPLDVKLVEEQPAPAPIRDVRPCALHCAYNPNWLAKHGPDQPCAKCLVSNICSGELVCSACSTHYPIRNGIPNLMLQEIHRDWVEAEQKWWDQKYVRLRRAIEKARDRRRAAKGRVPGPRYYERSRYLFAPLKQRRVRGSFVVEIGSGAAQYVAVLLPPEREGYFYVGTDVAREGLVLGAELMPEGDFVQCAVANFPFRNASLDTLLSFGVLHHVPMWQNSLEQLIERLKPGGWLLLNEAIDKPKLAGGVIKKSLGAAIDSPHGGDVSHEELLDVLGRNGRVLVSLRRTSPLLLMLMSLLGRFVEQSPLLTEAALRMDQFFLKTVGRLIPRLGATELLAIFEKTDIQT